MCCIETSFSKSILLACPAWLPNGPYKVLLFLFFIFSLTALLETNYFKIYHTDIHQIFRICRPVSMCVQIWFWPSFNDRSRDIGKATNFGLNRRNWPIPHHSLHWRFETDWKITVLIKCGELPSSNPSDYDVIVFFCEASPRKLAWGLYDQLY